MSTALRLLVTAVLVTAAGSPAPGSDDPRSWTADPVHSSANFTVTHLAISHVSGIIPIREATIVTPNGPELPAKITATLDLGGVDTRNGDRDADLKSPHFFDVAQYPTMTFSSTKIAAVDAKTFTVTGDLTLHGVTKPVTLETTYLGRATGPHGEPRAAYEAKTTLSRSAFGITYVPAVVGDDVTVVLDIEAVGRP